MNFRNYADLVRDTMLLAPALRDVDAIIGVPRSGMLPATILACALHKSLAIPGGPLEHGARMTAIAQDQCRSVAIVDDSVFTGEAMEFALEMSADMYDEVLRACVYMKPGSEEHVDHYSVLLDQPRAFEWNLFGSELIKHCLLDIDGVLCPDPPMPEDDARAYEDYIASAPVLHRPLNPVTAICTNRIERHRQATEEWLAANEIEYGRLYMAPFPSARARRAMSTPADLKSVWYDGTKADLLIESHDHIAEQVAANVGQPVISVQSWRCFE